MLNWRTLLQNSHETLIAVEMLIDAETGRGSMFKLYMKASSVSVGYFMASARGPWGGLGADVDARSQHLSV